MSTFRLKGKCAICGTHTTLRPNETMMQHGDARDRAEMHLAGCPAQRAKADEEHAKELARIDRHEAESRELLAAIEKAEKRLAKKGAADA